MPSNIFLLVQYVAPLLLFFLSLYSIYTRKSPSSLRTKKLPSPPQLPVLGNLHQLGKYAHRNLWSLSRKYGDLMLLHLGSKPTLIVSSAEVALQVLKTHDLAFCSRPQWKILNRIFNNGKDMVSAPYGEYWKNMKSICVLELLGNRRVQSYRGIMEEQVAIMVETIKQKVSSSLGSDVVINTREVFVSFTIDLIHRVTLGRKHEGDGSGVEFEKLLREVSSVLGGFPIGDFVPWLAWIDKLSGFASRVDKLAKSLDDYFERVFAQHCEGEREGEIDTRGDFVSVLLQVQKSGGKSGYMSIDRDSIKGLLFDIFAAGVETSSGTLEWTMSELIRNPRVMEKLKEEVMEIADGKCLIAWEDLKRMVCLKAVIKESLRLHPPGPLLSPRECRQDVEINGYEIASGTLVLVNAWGIARDPKYWDKPEDFLPERFLSSSDTRSYDFKMIPFGYGRRACPGESFATATMELAIANLLLHFDWSTPPRVEKESLDMRELPGITAKRMNPLLVGATIRNF